ncbi:6-hydroxy-D-nicotine oxidase [Bradyrhizobium sp. STM 3843]|uniref:FAD-binding oxidoreductase n=1 Tax=Bradyrhizobium sp. STM 3843 TaxID=551947 RepID=UPI0002403CAB|nr:FAD-binding oxidoreductase [Bradyrhizobium sp. STM 3843]CCE07883.1 6-hydroxy-D-nicotine oxidase [Bradyrhizobium sp. STM 3843]
MSELSEQAALKYGSHLADRIFRPDSAGYDAAIRIWAKPVSDGRPHVVIRCQTASDVQAAIRIAREHDLPLSVRCGGHDWAGRALCNGIVIDLGGMRQVSILPGNQRVEIGGGALAADVAAITDPQHRAVAAGSVGCVGMAGLTLGGGYGPFIGRCGLALDNLLAAEVVLADGRIVTTDAENHPELFWALRGGGGNFGVVTRMQHRLHECPGLWSGMLIYPIGEAATVLAAATALTAAGPDALSVQFVLAADPTGAPMVVVVPAWCGDPADGQRWLAPFLKLGTLIAGSIARQSNGMFLAAFDAQIVNGRRTYMETCSLPAFDRTAIEAFVRAMAIAPSPGCMLVTHEFKGAASRVASDATPFALRRDHVLVEIVAAFDDRGNPDDERAHSQWARRTRESFATALAGGYPNLLARSETARAAASYADNSARLLGAKTRYDPDNLFSSAIPLPSRT